MGTERQDSRVGRSKRGRPARPVEEARSHRVVTFVTARELEGLEQIAQAEDRSLSAVVHRIVARHLGDIGATEAEGVQEGQGESA